MAKESAKVPDELIPNNKRNFYKKKYPIQKTKFIILALAVILVGWNGYNMIVPSDSLSGHYSDILNVTQPYKKSFVPLSIVNYFKGDPKTMTREECYNIMDSQSQSGLIPWDWSVKSRQTASDLCKVTTLFAKTHEQTYGIINCQQDYFYALESYYNNNHANIFIKSDDTLENIQKSSNTRNIMLFVYDLFSFVVFFMIIWKINLNRIFLPSFFSIFNVQAHYNIAKIFRKKQTAFGEDQSCVATIEKIMDALFLLFFLYITFAFPIYVIAQLLTVFNDAQSICSIQEENLNDYQSSITKLIEQTITEQQRGSSFFSSAFDTQYKDVMNYYDTCKNTNSIVAYLFGSVRQILVTVQLFLIIINAFLNIITIFQKFCTKKFVDYYELRKDLRLHAVPFVNKKLIFPYSDDPSSVKVDDYNEQDDVSQQSAYSDASLNGKETINTFSNNLNSTNQQARYNPNNPYNARHNMNISKNQLGIQQQYIPPIAQNLLSPNNLQQQLNYGNQNNMNFTNNNLQPQNIMNGLNQLGQNHLQGLFNQFNGNQFNANQFQQGNNQQYPF